MTTGRAALFLLTVAGILLLVHYYSVMPERMASHFGGTGVPNGWQSKDGFFYLSGGILLSVLILFGGLGPLFRRIPSTWFNLPNRDYWLSPERREASIDFMARQMEWFGVASLVLWLLVLKVVFDANLSPDPRLDSTVVWWVLGGYFGFTTVWLVRFLLRFRKPRAEPI